MAIFRLASEAVVLYDMASKLFVPKGNMEETMNKSLLTMWALAGLVCLATMGCASGGKITDADIANSIKGQLEA
ncbi:hypothetical protein K8I31_03245, partial [bacterium]|nr:hypothetical protein [bacterium]